MEEKNKYKTYRTLPRTFITKEKQRDNRTNSDESEEEKSIYDVTPLEFRKILELHGTTQTQFAKKMGFSQQKVSDYLQGMDIPVSWITCLIGICGEEQYKYILSQVRKGKFYRKRLRDRI